MYNNDKQIHTSLRDRKDKMSGIPICIASKYDIIYEHWPAPCRYTQCPLDPIIMGFFLSVCTLKNQHYGQWTNQINLFKFDNFVCTFWTCFKKTVRHFNGILNIQSPKLNCRQYQCTDFLFVKFWKFQRKCCICILYSKVRTPKRKF